MSNIKRTKEKPLGGTLQSWFFNDYKSISGYLYADPQGRWPDGSLVMTSNICKLDRDNNILETLNTKYILGNSLQENIKVRK